MGEGQGGLHHVRLDGRSLSAPGYNHSRADASDASAELATRSSTSYWKTKGKLFCFISSTASRILVNAVSISSGEWASPV
jgi:hypothetical protein